MSYYILLLDMHDLFFTLVLSMWLYRYIFVIRVCGIACSIVDKNLVSSDVKLGP
jgi:hypothetical protein